MIVKSYSDVYNVLQTELRQALSSIAANVKARKSLPRRHRRRAMLIVDELRFNLNDVEGQSKDWKHNRRMVCHIVRCVDELMQSASRCRQTKFARAIGIYISNKLENVINAVSYADEHRLRRYGIYWDGSHYSNE